MTALLVGLRILGSTAAVWGAGCIDPSLALVVGGSLIVIMTLGGEH